MSETVEVGEQPLPEKGAEELQTDHQPLLETPWRVPENVSLEDLKETLANYTPVRLIIDPVSATNVLLMGPVGSGKSSFFNTVNSAFEDHVTFRAGTGSLGHSVTIKYRRYTVFDPKAGLPMKFRICDTIGLHEKLAWDGEDYSAIFKGYMGEGFHFGKRSPKNLVPMGSYSYRNSIPKMDEKVHCLVIVLDSCTLDSVNETVWQKIKDMRKVANEIDVPQAVLLTKVDQLDARVGLDVSLVFRSPAVEDAVSRAATLVGVPRAHVLLVKNYESEGSSVPEMEKLALLSLRSMLRLADDAFHNLPHENPKPLNKPAEKPTPNLPHENPKSLKKPAEEPTPNLPHENPKPLKKAAEEPARQRRMPPYNKRITEPEPPQDQAFSKWAVIGFFIVIVGMVAAYKYVELL